MFSFMAQFDRKSHQEYRLHFYSKKPAFDDFLLFSADWGHSKCFPIFVEQQLITLLHFEVHLIIDSSTPFFFCLSITGAEASPLGLNLSMETCWKYPGLLRPGDNGYKHQASSSHISLIKVSGVDPSSPTTNKNSRASDPSWIPEKLKWCRYCLASILQQSPCHLHHVWLSPDFVYRIIELLSPQKTLPHVTTWRLFNHRICRYFLSSTILNHALRSCLRRLIRHWLQLGPHLGQKRL